MSPGSPSSTGFYIYCAVYFQNDPARWVVFSPFVLFRTLKLCAVSNLHKARQLVLWIRSSSLVSALAVLPWERPRSHLLLSGKVYGGYLYFISQGYLTCVLQD